MGGTTNYCTCFDNDRENGLEDSRMFRTSKARGGDLPLPKIQQDPKLREDDHQNLYSPRSENSRNAFDAMGGSPGRIKKREGTGSTELLDASVSTAQKD